MIATLLSSPTAMAINRSPTRITYLLDMHRLYMMYWRLMSLTLSTFAYPELKSMDDLYGVAPAVETNSHARQSMARLDVGNDRIVACTG